jgi:L-histidine N-alpha-methyltransferase
MRTAWDLLDDFDGLEVLGVIGDFARCLGCLPQGRKLICFFGSTIGNFGDPQAVELLAGVASFMSPEDALLVGMDMLKPAGVIEAAYNDRAGITARFNLNILRHVNERLGSDFCLADFRHRAFFDHELSRIEMHLEAIRSVTADIPDIGLKVRLARGETIRTEISRKFARPKARKLFSLAGLEVVQWYTDARGWFSLVELRLA